MMDLYKTGLRQSGDPTPIDYTDEQKRALRRAWRSCTLAELDKLSLSVERCAGRGAFTRRSAKFLKLLLEECRKRQEGCPQTAEEVAAFNADVVARLRAEAASSERERLERHGIYYN
ncbi:MAG: hypothetical protein LBK23_02910 [Oscillospiraceae bacterium]|jgi:hypothetical protein|nr:hypothetical protein [Oscillospiraceae bacterium]